MMEADLRGTVFPMQESDMLFGQQHQVANMLLKK